jgi:hypothetical protein
MIMKTVNPSPADFERLVASIPEETPVTSLNLLRFREWAAYPSSSDFEPCSGREAYQRYLDIVSVNVAAAGGQVQWMTDVLARLTGPESEAWDAVVVVRYPSFKAFLGMAAAMPGDYLGPIHRTAALEDSRTFLIRTPES